MGATVKASQTGLELIDRARRQKGWKKTESAWYGLANTTESTLKRFWRGMAIQQEVFVAICREVGVEDWQSIADLTPATDQNVAVDIGFIPSTYRQATWVERTELTAKLLEVLRSSCRLLVLAGMTGIGKTALAERLIAELETEEQSDAPSSGRSSRKRFCRLNLDDGGVSADFSLSGAALLRSLGEEPTLADQQDPTNLLNHLLHTLRTQPYRVQIDSLEKLLEGDDLQSNGRAEREGWSEFCDPLWLDLWQQFLAGGDCQSQVILTTQEVPAGLEAIGSRYPQFWSCELLRGLNEAEQLELFGKAGLCEQPPNLPQVGDFRTEVSANSSMSESVDRSGSTVPLSSEDPPAFGTPLNKGGRGDQPLQVDQGIDYLKRIGKLYAGHPLVLRVIAEDIKENCGGNIKRYWQQGGFEQLEANRPAKFSRRRLQLEVKQRVSDALAKLSDDALQLLCRASVYRRPVPAAFWFALLPERTESQQQAALNLLQSRSFAEEDWESEVWLGAEASIPLRQHNLIRAVAYERLKADRTRWETAERQAAEIWLTAYEPDPDAPNLEKLRGYLEAFHHYCELEDWDKASEIYTYQIPSTNQTLYWHLFVLGQYRELIKVSSQLLKGNAFQTKIKCLLNLGNSYSCLGNQNKAIEYYQQALTIAHEIGDRQGEGDALGNLGVAYKNLGNYQQAIDYHQQRLTIAREIGDRQGEGNALGNLGNVYHNQGNYQQAIACHQQCLIIAHAIGVRRGEGNALGNLGNIYHDLGNYQQAIACHQQNLTIAREIGDRRGQGIVLVNWGHTLIKLEKCSDSLQRLQSSLEIFREIGDRTNEAEALLRLAELHQKTGELDRALDYCDRALALAIELGIPLVKECEELKQQLEEKQSEGDR